MSEEIQERVGAELQRLTLELRRERDTAKYEIARLEKDGARVGAYYERGKCFGLNLALDRLSQLKARQS